MMVRRTTTGISFTSISLLCFAWLLFSYKQRDKIVDEIIKKINEFYLHYKKICSYLQQIKNWKKEIFKILDKQGIVFSIFRKKYKKMKSDIELNLFDFGKWLKSYNKKTDYVESVYIKKYWDILLKNVIFIDSILEKYNMENLNVKIHNDFKYNVFNSKNKINLLFYFDEKLLKIKTLVNGFDNLNLEDNNFQKITLKSFKKYENFYLIINFGIYPTKNDQNEKTKNLKFLKNINFVVKFKNTFIEKVDYYVSLDSNFNTSEKAKFNDWIRSKEFDYIKKNVFNFFQYQESA